MQHLECSGTPVLYIGRTVLKGVLCFVDRASGYNRVKKNQLDALFFLSIFFYIHGSVHRSINR